MRNIQIKVLNPDDVKKAEQMMVFCARITQRGHKIKNMNDIDTLLNKEYSYATVKKYVYDKPPNYTEIWFN